jgi:hypothetical protein
MSNPLNLPDRHKLIQRFEWNARYVFEDSTSLYFRLTRELIGDGKLLVLASDIPPHQPAPNLFFSAVHYLLLRNPEAGLRLREFFPDLTPQVNTQDDPYPIFREFCLTHATELRALLQTRSVQVNEIARCAFFLPAFQIVSERVGGEPFVAIEVGASAGLNLLWDEYGYDYGDVIIYGARKSEIVLPCELRGSRRPSLATQLPRVAFRFGIDLSPNDVFDEDAMLWLRALVWPEQIARAERLEKAIALARQRPPLMIQGDALEIVPRALDAIAPDMPVVLFHSFVLNQFSDRARAQYYAQLTAYGAQRRIYDLAIEPKDWPSPLVLTTYENGKVSERTLAACDHLGRWMKWYA